VCTPDFAVEPAAADRARQVLSDQMDAYGVPGASFVVVDKAGAAVAAGLATTGMAARCPRKPRSSSARHPRASRHTGGGDAANVHPAAAEFDEERDVGPGRPDRLDGEEVGRLLGGRPSKGTCRAYAGRAGSPGVDLWDIRLWAACGARRTVGV